MNSTESVTPGGQVTTVARLCVGLVQGLALYALWSAIDAKVWPATSGLLFSPLASLAFFIPLLALVSIGNLRAATFAVWIFVAAIIVAGLSYYDIWRWPTETPGEESLARLWPSFELFFFTTAGLFIAHSLIVGGDRDRRFMASYATHFDVAWVLGLQAVLSALFAAIFWGVLELGAALFNLLDIQYFSTLIEHRWFAIPATTLAFAAGIHLSDVRPALVRGARTLVLVLLSWLLPLMAIIVAGFLATILFTGFAPLWKTGFAAGYLLIAAGLLVFLINAAYQDGDSERQPPTVLRYAGTLAAFLLVPLVAISVYAIALRVEQYGWTTERVASAACVVVAASYAGGYALAALPFGPWLAGIARWNFFTASLVLAVLFAIFSPLVDPIRISVASQVSRLESGEVAPSKFDFDYLRWHSGRAGLEGLRHLATFRSGPDAAGIRKFASDSLAGRSQYAPVTGPSDLMANVTVYPRGKTLPQNFLKQNWESVGGSLPPCMRTMGNKCDAYLLDMAGDGKREVAVITTGPAGGYPFSNGLFAQQPDGSWKLVGRPDSQWSCKSVAQALRSGKFDMAAPAPWPWRDIVVPGNTKLTIHPLDPDTAPCAQ